MSAQFTIKKEQGQLGLALPSAGNEIRVRVDARNSITLSLFHSFALTS